MVQPRVRRFLSMVAVVCFLSIGGPISVAPAKGPGKPAPASILPPGGVAYGKTYGEWQAEFWKWAFSLPTTAHPLFDTAPCDTGQTGPVWFLGGSFKSTTDTSTGITISIADRTCVIPPNKAIYVAIANSEASDLEGNGTNFDELDASAAFFASFIDPDSLSIEIDGQAVADVPSYFASSPLYRFKLAKTDNLLAPPGTPSDLDGARGISVSRGYGVLLGPLSPGLHVIHFHADFPDFNFLLDITYHITVPAH